MGAGRDLRDEIYAYFEDEMRGRAPDSIRMLERYAPGAMEGFYRLRKATTVESALPKKVRELIIIAVEAALKKDPTGHARIAVEAGATPQEIHDAVALSLWLAGMPAYHHGMKAVEAAEEHVETLRRGYPVRSVSFVAAAPPGGGWYQTCEATVRVLKEERLLPVEPELVATSNGIKVLEEMVTDRRGDGHTLVAFSPGLTLQILLRGSPYTYADITPIAALSTDYGAFVVPATSPLRDLAALLAALRRDAASVPVGGGSGPGAMHEGMARMVAAAAGIPPSSVRYVGAKGVAAGKQALASGETPVAALGAADVLEEVRRGTLRVLAVLAAERLPGPLASMPTAREQGVDIVFPMWRGFYAPPGVPETIVAYWTDLFTRMTRTPAWARLLEEAGWFPFFLAGDRFRAFLEEDTRRYASVLAPSRA
jgi:putative tricarboxylic transport membrane protein